MSRKARGKVKGGLVEEEEGKNIRGTRSRRKEKKEVGTCAEGRSRLREMIPV